MARLTRKLQERYYDGELSERKRRRVEAMLAESPEAQANVQRLAQLGNLLRTMNEENVSHVSFDGFETRVLNSLDRAPRLGVAQRTRVWLGEFIEHRKIVWIPSAAVVTAAAAVMLVLAFVTGPTAPQSGVYQSGPQVAIAPGSAGIAFHSTEESTGSEIVSVNFGGSQGFTTSVQNERGETLGVVWINE